MNQGRIWCVVKPTVGLPLFLGTVLLISLAVHYSILSNTAIRRSSRCRSPRVFDAALRAPGGVRKPNRASDRHP
jgi:light-harvesting protein B-800-850 alpha chain